MLQFITQNDEKYSIAEQAQMAIEGGCQWIQLHVPDADDGELRELAAELVPLCRENATILTLEDNAEMARELGLHGLLLTHGTAADAVALRDELGAEAIIGLLTGDVAEILSLRGRDIDYVALPCGMDAADRAAVVSEVRGAGFDIPIVATGRFTPADVPALLASGISGIATGSALIEDSDPAEAIGAMIAALQRL